MGEVWRGFKIFRSDLKQKVAKNIFFVLAHKTRKTFIGKLVSSTGEAFLKTISYIKTDKMSLRFIFEDSRVPSTVQQLLIECAILYLQNSIEKDRTTFENFY